MCVCVCVFSFLYTCEEQMPSEGWGDHGNASNEDICLSSLLLVKCVCVCVQAKPSVSSVVPPEQCRARPQVVFLFLSLHAESSCCFPLFMALHLSFNCAPCLFLHTSLCQCFPSLRLRNLNHLLFANLRYGGKSLYCFIRSLSFLSNSVNLCFLIFVLSVWKIMNLNSWKSIHMAY